MDRDRRTHRVRPRGAARITAGARKSLPTAFRYCLQRNLKSASRPVGIAKRAGSRHGAKTGGWARLCWQRARTFAPTRACLWISLWRKPLENLGEVLPQGFLARAGFAGIDVLSPRGSARPARRNGLPPLLAGAAATSISRPTALPKPRWVCSTGTGGRRSSAGRAYPFHFARR